MGAENQMFVGKLKGETALLFLRPLPSALGAFLVRVGDYHAKCEGLVRCEVD
jgi:hypothetical protein